MTDFKYLHPFRRYSTPNFKVVRNQAKFCMFLAPKIFCEWPLKILDWHYKIHFTTDYRAEFLAGRPTHLGDFALKGRKNICSKT